MEKIFGAVILYHPPDGVQRHIQTYLDKVEKLFIFDNSERAVSHNFGEFGDKVIVIADGVNRGIAERLNTAARWAITENATWLLTMDQDSFFPPGSLDQYLCCVNSYAGEKKVGMFGVEFEKQSSNFSCEAEETTSLITSGSMVNLNLFHEIGGFDEQLFIDEVDFEYCLKAKSKGYLTLKFKNVYLKHYLGTVSQHRSLKGFKKTSRTLHAPLRLYYMIRNYLYVRKKYDIPAKTLAYKRTDLLNRVKNHLLYGKEHVKVIRYVFLAFKHYNAGRMGKLIK